MITSFRPAVAALAAFVGLTGPDALHAQSYPARSVTLVVPSAAGGGTDTIARLIGDQLAKIGLEGIGSKRKGSPYRSGRSPDWLKMKNPDAPAVKREAEEDWR